MKCTWADTQAALAARIIDAALPPLPGVIGCRGPRQRAGFAVHRNNSLVALVDALRERFPVSCRLVGEEFFGAMACSYVGERPPRSPLLIHYGDDFPDFIDAFTPADGVPYLADVARLEVAWSDAYHASEARSLQLQALVDMPLEALLEMRLTLHPSARVLRSVYPVAAIWAAHQSSGAVMPPTRWDAQDVLVVRPEADVQVRTLGPGVYAFVSALLDRVRVQDAAEIALGGSSEFDAGSSIVDLFDVGVVVALGVADTDEGAK
jgi:Putative DNA-binding domain